MEVIFRTPKKVLETINIKKKNTKKQSAISMKYAGYDLVKCTFEFKKNAIALDVATSLLDEDYKLIDRVTLVVKPSKPDKL